MARIIAIVNQKGGCGKTTVTVNLGSYLAKFGNKVLIIDIDPQGNASTHLGINIHELEISLYDVLINTEMKINDIIKPTEIENLFIAPSNINLSGAEIELVNVIGREVVLKESLNHNTLKEYHYILIDCPPSLGILTLNALTTAKEILIPVQTEFFALEGMGKLLNTIDIVKKKLNPELEIEGIIITLFDKRTNLGQEVMKKVCEFFGDKVYKNTIRRNVKLAEAPSHGQPIITYSPNSYGSLDFEKLTKELLKRETS